MAKIPYETAEKEITSWLDYKKIGSSKRIAKKENIETLINAISDGDLVLDPKTFTLKQTLKFPLKADGEIGITDLAYKSRLSTAQVGAALQSAKLNDAYGIVAATISALTGELIPSVKEIDSEDFGTASAIASFFLPG
jgi:hypothetical protein